VYTETHTTGSCYSNISASRPEIIRSHCSIDKSELLEEYLYGLPTEVTKSVLKHHTYKVYIETQKKMGLYEFSERQKTGDE
jgi:hypothetical protein